METDTTVATPAAGQDDDEPGDTALEDYEFQDETDDSAEGEDAAPEKVSVSPFPQLPQPTVAELIQQAKQEMAQQWQSWSGRRDKDLLDTIGNMIRSQTPQQPAQAPVASSDPATILDNPDAWVAERIKQLVPGVLNQEINRQTAAERNYSASLVQNIGQMMESDPFLAVNRDFGSEVIAEIHRSMGTINKGLPTDVNASILVNSAVANIYKRKAAASKPNALAGNTGIKEAVGGVGPPKTPPPPKGKVIKLSPDAQKLANRWGYKEEDLQRVFKDA